MMTANNFRPSGVSSDTPSLDSGAFGLETATPNDINFTPAMSSIIPEQKKPQVPQKRANLDELFRLRKELIDLREEKEQAEEMSEMMGQDLFRAEEEVAAKGDELKRKEAKLLDYEEQVKTWRERAQSLTLEVQEANRVIAETKQASDIREMAISSKAESSMQKEQELLNLQEQVTQLKATLDEKDAELTDKIALAAGKAYDKWQAVLKDKQLEFDSKLKESEERATADLSQQQELRREAEEALRDLSEQLDTNANQEQELRRSAEASLHDVRRELQTASSQLSHEQKLRVELQARLQNMSSEFETTSSQLSREQALRRTADATLQNTILHANSSATQFNQERALRQAAEAALQTAKAQHETHLREVDSRLTELQTRVQESEAVAREHANRMEVQVEQEWFVQWIGALEAEVAEQKRRCEWFQRNSERLSREIKDVQALKREMEMGGQGVRSRG